MSAFDRSLMDAAAATEDPRDPSIMFRSWYTPNQLVNIASAALAALPDAECEILCEINLAAMRQGDPIPPLEGVMDEAWRWADMASPAEVRAYAWASFHSMPLALRQRFLSRIYAEACEVKRDS